MKQFSDLQIKHLLARELDPAFYYRAFVVMDELKKEKPQKVLNVGCGRGFYEAAILKLLPKTEVFSIDLSNEYLDQAKETISSFKNKKNVNLLKADAHKLPFKSASFDFVICSEVLEHVRDDKKVLTEIFRVLKKNKSIILTVPHKNYPFLWDPINFFLERIFNTHIPANIWWLAGIWAGHVRLYEEDDLISKIKLAHFENIKVTRIGRFSLPFAHFLLYGIGKNLVERGIIFKEFNRFETEHKVSLILKIIKIPLFAFGPSFAKSSQRYVSLVIRASTSILTN